MPSDSPENATLNQLNALGRRGHAWLETKPLSSAHVFGWAVKVANAEGVGRLLRLDGADLGWPWVGMWPLGEELGRNCPSLLRTLSPELLVKVAKHVLGPPCLPREHGDERPAHRASASASASHRAWCFQQFLLSCEHVYRTITRDAMHLRVEAGARRLLEVSPTRPEFHALAHTQHLERSARSALEFTAFSIALTEGVIKPCTEDWYRYEWARMHANLAVGFARMGFRENALLARALERRDLALRHTHLGTHCAIQCMVHGGGAIVTAFDRPSMTWRNVHIRPASEHDRRGAALPVIDLADADEPRVTPYAPPAPYSWLSCLRTCASTHWVVFAGLCVTDDVITRPPSSSPLDESAYKGWIALHNLHTGEQLFALETDAACGSMKQMWMRVDDDARTLELFALYVLPRDAHDFEGWKVNSNAHIVRRTFAVDAARRVVRMTESKTAPLHLGEPEGLGSGWRYLVPGEDPHGNGSWTQSNDLGPVTVTRAIASSSSGSIVLTMTGDVLAHPTVLKCVPECLTVRRVVVVDRALRVHHIRHTTGRETASRPVALISPSGNHVVVTNRWHRRASSHGAFIEVHVRAHTGGERVSGDFRLAARYDIDGARLRARSFDVSKLCAFSPCGRFLLLFFENATCAMVDVGECGHRSLLRFRALCNPAPRFYGSGKRFSNLQWNDSGIWLQTTHHGTTTEGNPANRGFAHAIVQNLALY